MSIFQLIRANDPSLDTQSLKTNILCWNDFLLTNPLAPHKLYKETQKRLFINEDDLPWTYQSTLSGEPIALDIVKLLTTVADLESLLYRYRYNTPDGLPRNLEQQVVLAGSSTGTAVMTKVEGSIALSTRTLLEQIVGYSDTAEPFLQISDKHIHAMGNILQLLYSQSEAVRGRMNELRKGENTTEKQSQVRILLDIESLQLASELQTLRLIHEIIVQRSDLGMPLERIKSIVQKRGSYFFLNVNAPLR
jgi:hypothetical protein